MRHRRLAPVLGGLALACSVVGYGLEWYRQRGTCESGDNSPDTLVMSVLLVLLGGGVVGFVALVVAVISVVRHGVARGWPDLAVAGAAVVSVVPLFSVAGGGPGAWFQYCAT